MNIPDKAIEAAVRAAFFEDCGSTQVELTDDERIVWDDHCKVILEAAAPFIAAQAWDEAADYYGAGQADVREGKRDNPYRCDQVITWHAQPDEHLEPGNIFRMAHEDEVEW